MVLKCKLLRRLDLTSRLKIEYLAGHQTEIFFEKLYSNVFVYTPVPNIKVTF